MIEYYRCFIVGYATITLLLTSLEKGGLQVGARSSTSFQCTKACAVHHLNFHPSGIHAALHHQSGRLRGEIRGSTHATTPTYCIFDPNTLKIGTQ